MKLYKVLMLIDHPDSPQTSELHLFSSKISAQTFAKTTPSEHPIMIEHHFYPFKHRPTRNTILKTELYFHGKKQKI